MTPSVPAPALTAVLDELDGLRAAIGDSPAFNVVGFEQDDWLALARFDDGGTSVFAECYGADAAALIVAAVNRLPQLTAALRAVLDLAADAAKDNGRITWANAGDAIHRAITTALEAS